MNDQARREVYAEAKILQELSHPTIIKYYAAMPGERFYSNSLTSTFWPSLTRSNLL